MRLYGSVVLEVHGEECEVPRRQLRRLLASLALRPGAPVAADKLIDDTWQGIGLPSDPRASLRVAVARLRRLLGTASEALSGSIGQYQLACTSDLSVIESTTAQIQAGGDDVDLRRAAERLVDRTSGDPLADVGGTPLYDGSRSRCVASRLELVVALGSAMMSANEPQRAVALLQQPHENDPGREDLTTTLARAFAALGRKTEALAAIRRTREFLRDEIGANPGAELSDLEVQILQGAVDLPRIARVAPPRHAGAAFVGREAELARLTRAHERAVLVIGVAGIGKTALLDQVMTHLRSDGEILTTAVPQVASRPMATIADLVEHILDHPATDRLVAERARSLHRLVPHRVEPMLGTSGPVGRDELLEAARVFLVDHLDRTGATLVLDDCHWLDRASADVLLSAISADAIPFIGALRPEPSQLADTIVDAEVLALGPLDLDHTQELVQQRSPLRCERSFAEALHGRSGGNPLFLTMLLDLDREGALQADVLPPSILTAVQQRVADLSLRSRRTLSNASVLEGPFTSDLLADISRDPEGELTEAVELELLGQSDDGAFVFSHALMREAIEQLLAPGERVAAHDAVGRALEQTGAPATRYSRHYVYSLDLDPHRAIAATLLSAREAAAAFDWPQCGEFAQLALKLGRELGTLSQSDEADLLLLSGMALRRTAQENEDVLLAASATALATDDDKRIVEAVIELCSHGSTSMSGVVHPQALADLQAALARDLGPIDRARIQAAATPLLSNSELGEWGRDMYVEALATVADHNDPQLEAEVLLHSHLGLTHPDDLEVREANGLRLAELGENDPDARWESAFLLLHAAMARGDAAAAEISIDNLRTETPLLRYRNRDLGLSFSEAAYANLYGRFEECERHIGRIFEVGLGFSPGWVQLIGGGVLAALLHAQGRLADARDFTNGQLAEVPDFPTFIALSSAVAVAEGDRDRARSDLALLTVDDRIVLPAADLPALLLPCLVAEAVRFVEDAALARPLYDWLSQYEDRFVWSGLATHGAVHRYLGGLAELLDDPAAVERHFAAADSMMAEFGVAYVGGPHLAQYTKL